MAETSFDAVSGSLNSNMFLVPDYQNRVTITVDANYKWTVTEDGWIMLYCKDGGRLNILINGVECGVCSINSYVSTALFPVKQGDSYKLTGGTGTTAQYFIPYR